MPEENKLKEERHILAFPSHPGLEDVEDVSSSHLVKLEAHRRMSSGLSQFPSFIPPISPACGMVLPTFSTS